jgi:hypothetical protein
VTPFCGFLVQLLDPGVCPIMVRLSNSGMSAFSLLGPDEQTLIATAGRSGTISGHTRGTDLILPQFDCGSSVNIAQTHLVNERSLDSIETPYQSVQAHFTLTGTHLSVLASARKESGERNRYMLKDNQAFNACPRCGKAITLDGREPHPTRADIELRNFQCESCGPVKTVAVSVRASTLSPKIAV